MRQFILAGNVAYTAALNNIAVGAIALSGIKSDGSEELVSTANAADYKGKRLNLYTKPEAKLGLISYPVFAKGLTFVKSAYAAASTFTAKVAIGAPAAKTDYTIIVAKKGVKFNERNKWTATVHTGSVAGTAQALAKALEKHINNNSLNSGVKATSDTSSVTITATKPGVDYEVIVADGLMGAAISAVTHGIPAINDATAIKDMMNKAAADAGFEYTYDEMEGLYPAYEVHPLDGTRAADSGFTVFTLRFGEPRENATTDELVYQIVQVAFPTGAGAIATFETILKAIAA